MNRWQVLERELNCWAAAGRTAGLWWRDDDAGARTPALDRLLDLAERCGQPLALAVIPSAAEPALAQRLAASSGQVDVLQHGFAHRNHAPAGEKKCELVGPGRRPEVFAELRRGRALLEALFGERARAILVPPWNRIDPEVMAELPALGLIGLSTYKARARAEPRPGLRQVNCHLDIMQWRPERCFLGEEASLALLSDHLRAKRKGSADPDEPTGVLSHHGAHDKAAWCFLEELLDRLARHPAAELLSAEAVFLGAVGKTEAGIEAGGAR